MLFFSLLSTNLCTFAPNFRPLHPKGCLFMACRGDGFGSVMSLNISAIWKLRISKRKYLSTVASGTVSPFFISFFR